MSEQSVLRYYYAATLVFLVLDFVFNINIRVAFLEASPGWRIAYYVACLALLGLMFRFPGWSALLGVAESLLTLVALILSMAVRVMVVTEDMIEAGRGFVSTQELVNFVISGGIAWYAWQQRMRALAGNSRRTWH